MLHDIASMYLIAFACIVGVALFLVPGMMWALFMAFDGDRAREAGETLGWAAEPDEASTVAPHLSWKHTATPAPTGEGRVDDEPLQAVV